MLTSREWFCLAFLSVSAGAVAAPGNRAMKFPLEFEINRGQFAPQVLYLARTPDHSVYLTQNGFLLRQNRAASAAALRMELAEGDPRAEVTPERPLAGVSNYFIGNDPARWRRGVAHYAAVRYRAVWPGIDLVVHGRDQTLEYDFTVAPGADPDAIRLRYPNAAALRLDAGGNLIVETAAGSVIQHLPEIYQESNGVRTPVRGAFRILADREVRFQVKAYDGSRPLVIDPTVTYSTYIGASGTVAVKASAVDSSGNFYIGGEISSPDFPTVGSIEQFSTSVGLYRSTDQGTTWGTANATVGLSNVLSVAVDPSTATTIYAGTSHGVYKTTNSGTTWTSSSSGMPNAAVTSVAVDPLAPKTLYACQSEALYKSSDSGATWKSIYAYGCTAVAVDPKTEGTIWVANSYDYPAVSRDGGSTYTWWYHKIVANTVVIDPNNSNYIYFGTDNEGLVRSLNGGSSFTSISSGLLTGGIASANVNAIAIDPRNSARILVGTDTGVYLSTDNGTNFVAGSGVGTRKVRAVAYDPNSDNIALAGTAAGGVYRSTDIGQSWTSSGPANLDVTALAMTGDERYTFAALYTGSEAFVTKINSAGTAILYSTYLGGSGTTSAQGLAVDSAGHAFLCGSTGAADFPTQNAYQSKIGGGTDFFVSRLSANGSSLDASTFFGGRSNDGCYGAAVDSSGNVYLAGTTVVLSSGVNSGFPVANGFATQGFGGQDCVIVKFNNSLQSLIYSTFLGGNSSEGCWSIAADSSGNAYVTGTTFSTNFLVTRAPFGGNQPVITNDKWSSFIAKIKPDGSALVYSGLLGGTTGTTETLGIAVDSAGRAYVTGWTQATDYPVTSGALATSVPSSAGAKTMITAIAADGSKLVYSTILSGTGGDDGLSIAVDSNNTAWVTGIDFDGKLPVTSDALAITPAASAETPFLVAIDSTGSTLLHATYLGGTAGGEWGPVAVGSDGSVYVASATYSNDFTLSGTPFGITKSADSYTFLMRLVFSSSGGSGGSSTVPAITSVQNGASFQDGFPINAWMTIKGTNLASVSSDTWASSITSGNLPTTLDGVTVTVGGQPAYMAYVSPTQINVVAPNIAAGSTTVVVKNALGTSAAFTTTAQSYQPAFFIYQGHAVASHYPDYSYASTAKPGDVLILWGTGFGPTTPAAPVGSQVPSTAAYPTSGSVTVTIGGTSATVYGAALASGYAALYQVAIQVPASLADGDYPIVASVGGASSPSSALITIQH